MKYEIVILVNGTICEKCEIWGEVPVFAAKITIMQTDTPPPLSSNAQIAFCNPSPSPIIGEAAAARLVVLVVHRAPFPREGKTEFKSAVRKAREVDPTHPPPPLTSSSFCTPGKLEFSPLALPLLSRKIRKCGTVRYGK